VKRQICQRSTGWSSGSPCARIAIFQNGGAWMPLMKRLVSALSPSTLVLQGASSISGWPMLPEWT
jgi:hypothetical protein